MFTRDKGAETISQRRKVPMDGTQRPCQSDSVSFAVIYSIPPIRYRRWLQVCQRIRPVSKTNRSHVYQQFKAAGRDCRRGIETWSGNSVESPRQVVEASTGETLLSIHVYVELEEFRRYWRIFIIAKKGTLPRIKSSFLAFRSIQPRNVSIDAFVHEIRIFEVIPLHGQNFNFHTDRRSIRESRCGFHFFAARGAVSAVNLIRMRG